MKSKVYRVLVVLVTIATLFSIINTVAATENTSTQTGTQTVSTDSASGAGWFFCNGHRDSFRFSVMKGTPRADGWNYNPVGYVTYHPKTPAFGILSQVNSTRIWRFRADPIDDGDRAIVAGKAQVKIGADVRNNWWFRITTRSMDDGKEWFMIQLWRPIGADKNGGWSYSDFNPYRPATLNLNEHPFYQAQGILAGGTITIKS